MSRYARQTIPPQFGAAGQAKLAKARVLVVGAGGLAASVLPLLAGAGIGHLTVLDPDIVDLSNLHRQVFFTEADVGESNVKAAAHRCRALNGEITVRTHKLALTPLNAPNLVTWSDLVIDCADSYAASYTLSDVCLGLNTPLISGSVLGMGGYAGGLRRRTVPARGFPGCARQRGELRDSGCVRPCRDPDRRDAGTDDAERSFGHRTVALGSDGAA